MSNSKLGRLKDFVPREKVAAGHVERGKMSWFERPGSSVDAHHGDASIDRVAWVPWHGFRCVHRAN